MPPAIYLTEFYMKLKLAAGVLAIAASVAAQAGTITLDGFDVAQTAVFTSGATVQSAAATGVISAYVNSRTLSIQGVAGNSPTNGSYAQVIGGLLDINNGSFTESTVRVGWDLNLAALSAALTDASFFQIIIRQNSLDAGSVTVGGSARTNATNNQNIVLASGTSLSGVTNPFSASFVSTVNADSTWEFVGLEYSCRAGANSINDADRAGGSCVKPTNVPVPATLALLGLGLLGFGATRRQTK
jgi:PEP-CTERM motif